MSRPLTIHHLQEMKTRGEKITVLTAYDAPMAQLMDRCGVDSVLVGDSLGMVVQGHDSTVSVTVEEMVYHTRCVSRGVQRAWLIADMPFLSYASADQAADTARRLLAAGASMVKLEGAGPAVERVAHLTANGVSVCGHLGLTPQWVHQFGGFRVQGRDTEAARAIAEAALALESAGAQLLVLECVPAPLAADISRSLTIPTIGIGAGVDTDGQVLVTPDILGLGDHAPRFVKNFLAQGGSIRTAVEDYLAAVRSGEFPGPEHVY